MGIDASEVYNLAADLAAAPAKAEAGSIKAVSSSTRQTARDARRFAAVLTGFMRENVEARVSGLSGEVVSLADYSEFQEYGTSKMPPHPFMRPAADLALDPLADAVLDSGDDFL